MRVLWEGDTLRGQGAGARQARAHQQGRNRGEANVRGACRAAKEGGGRRGAGGSSRGAGRAVVDVTALAGFGDGALEHGRWGAVC